MDVHERSESGATKHQAELDEQRAKVASRYPGTCSGSLWLLPSGPDQIHDPAMRGDPPLIGAQLPRTRSITAHRSAGQTCHGNVCAASGLPPARSSPAPAENGFCHSAGRSIPPSPSKGYDGHRRLRRGAASATTSGAPRSPWQGCANVRRHQDRRKPSTTRPETGRWTMRDRVFVRRLRSRCRRSLIGLAALSLLAFSGCEARAPRCRPASRAARRCPARPVHLVHAARRHDDRVRSRSSHPVRPRARRAT